jgi:hypothetical protein
MTESTITIKINQADKEWITRLAASQNRRFEDYVQLVFSDGLRFIHADECFHFQKYEEEMTQEQNEQLKKNVEIHSIPKWYDRKEELGYKNVNSSWSNYMDDKEGEIKLESISDNIKNYALN